MSDARLEELSEYLLGRSAVLDRDLLPFGDPAGKDVLIFGCGIGTEVPWCVRRGAKSIVGINRDEIKPETLEYTMHKCGLAEAKYDLRKQDIRDLALTGEKFDLILSNGVFEHIPDLKGILEAFRPLLRPKGRVSIFADGLWYSSIGGHIRRWEWEHLRWSQQELHDFTGPRWKVFTSAMNKITCVDFLEALRAVGALVLQLRMNSDPNIRNLPKYIDEIRERVQVTPTDLSIVSIGCELAFLETL